VAAISQLLREGVAVLGVDLLYQGEFLPDGEPLEKTPRVENPRESAAYTFGYNHTVFASRVHDVLGVVAFARKRLPAAESFALIALDGGGAWATAALAQADGAVDRAAIDTEGFRFSAVSDIHSPDFLPGGAKYLDLPGILALGAPCRLWIAGESEQSIDVVAKAYRALGQPARLTLYEGPAEIAQQAAVSWMLQP
jgi:hypothetical protein